MREPFVFIARCFLCLTGFMLVAGVFFLTGQKVASQSGLYRVSPEKNIFIFGHSRTAYAYNDSLLAGARNFANTAEPYFFTSAKVSQLLAANPQVKTVVIELSEIQMNQKQTDEWTFGRTFLAHHLPNYSSLLTFQQHWTLFRRSPAAYLRLLPLICRQDFGLIVRPRNNIFSSRNFGGYLVHDSSLISALNKTYKAAGSVSDDSIPSPSSDLDYLDDIVRLCQERNLNILLLRSPVHPVFNMRAHDSLWQSVYRSRYRVIPVIDLSAYPLPDSAYYDYHHLNKYGARMITPKLDSALSNWINVDR